MGRIRLAVLAALFCIVVSTSFTANAESLPNKITGKKTTYEIVKAGSGPAIKMGASVTVHATGIVKQTGKKFWSTKDTNQPFKYKAGVGSVITGWDQGCMGMKLGEIRKLDIPAEEGYGTRGFPHWGIPPNGGLDFEIEVLEIDNDNNYRNLHKPTSDL